MADSETVSFRPTDKTEAALRFGPVLARENRSEFIRRAVEERAERLRERAENRQRVPRRD